MADMFTARQGRRLFGFIGLGGTLGAIGGSALTSQLAPVVGPISLLLVSALLLELATLAVRRLSESTARAARPADPTPDADEIIGGSVLAGVTHVARSPYLLGICGYMLLFSIGSTVLYFQQAEFASATYAEPALRTAFFARLDLAVNLLTLVTQAFLTGRIVKLLGVAGTMTLLPVLSVIGFLALGASHTIAVFVVFQVLRRAGQFAVARPTVEVLYTVVSREDKYKAKNLIDTFVYRAGDQMGAWSYALVASLGLASASIAFLAAPLSGLWLLIAVWLGRRHEAMAPPPAAGPRAATAAPA
jgi:AAA family ATP:ADP antiporter